MNAEQFAYWFQGFAELSETPPTQAQWDSMREHVATVFKKVTPEVGTYVIKGTEQPALTKEQVQKISESLLQRRPPYMVTC